MASAKALVVRVRTRLRGRQLDRRIAQGAERPYDPVLTLREARLRAMPERKRLAKALERVLDAHSCPAPLSSAAPIDHRAVATAKPVLEELISSLRSPGDVAPQGVALGWCLLTDADGPIFASSRGLRSGSLWNAALSVLFALRPLAEAERSRVPVVLQ